jgi:hypothetical protein
MTLITRRRRMGVTTPFETDGETGDEAADSAKGENEKRFTAATSPPFARSLTNIRKHRRSLGKHRSIWIGDRIGTNDLSRMWSGQPELARHLIDTSGISQLCLSKTELAILFLELLHLLLLGFDVVSVFDGAEVLPAIHHDEAEEECHGAGKGAHLADTLRIVGLDNAGVVESLDEEDFGRGSATGALLRREQGQIALHEPVMCAAAGVNAGVRCDCLCRHTVVSLNCSY